MYMYMYMYVYIYIYVLQTVFTLKGFWRIVFWVGGCGGGSVPPPRPLTFADRLRTW